MLKKIIFIGIGNMGLPMARNLLRAGFQVTVCDKLPEKAKVLEEDGAKFTFRPIDAIEPGCTIITMLPNDEALLEVAFGQDGLVSNLRRGQIHISMSTVSPKTIQKVFDGHQRYSTGFIAAPVLGRPEAAAAKELWICTAGSAKVKKAVVPILINLCRNLYDFGDDIAAASTAKLGINFLVLTAIEALGESLAFVEKQGLDKKIFADLVTQTLFACPAYKYHAHKIASQDFSEAGFSLKLGMKDINLLMQTANEMHTPMPIASLLHNRLLSALAKKRENLDWAAITLNTFEEAGLI